MICNDTLVQMYVDRVLEPAELTVIEAHLQTCPQCRRSVIQYKALLWDMEHPAPSEPLPDELNRLSEALMVAWEAEQGRNAEPVSWIKASLLWTQTVPVVAAPLAAAQWSGKTVAKAGMKGLGQLLRSRFGGGRR